MKNSSIGEVIQECWHNIPSHFQNVQLDAFVIMPNHIHGIVWIDLTVGARHASPLPTNDNLFKTRKELALSPLRNSSGFIGSGVRSGTLGAIVGSFKSAVTKQVRISLSNPHLQIWQRNYFECIIRNERELSAVREYIINNTQNWSYDLEAKSDVALHNLAVSSLEVRT